MRRRSLVLCLVLALAACRALAGYGSAGGQPDPRDGSPGDGALGDGALGDGALGDGALWDGAPVDSVAGRDGVAAWDAGGEARPTCVEEDFSGAPGGWIITPITGTWKANSGYVRQTGTDVAQAKVVGSEQLAASGHVVVTASLRLDDVPADTLTHGAGVALLVEKGTKPAYKQVLCWLAVDSSVAAEGSLELAAFSGNASTAGSIASKKVVLLWRYFDLKVRMEATRGGAGWSVTCRLLDANDKLLRETSAALTTELAPSPQVAALVSDGADVEYSLISVCP